MAGQSYSGVASNVDLTQTVTITEPIDNDAQAAAAYNTALQKLADTAEALRVASVADAFGGGFDGNLVFDGTSTVTLGDSSTLTPIAGVYTLTRPIFANNITIAGSSTSVTVKTAGFSVFCAGTYTAGGGAGNAVLSCDGTDANANSNTVGVVGGYGGVLGANATGGNGGTRGAASNGTGASTTLANALGGAGGSGGTTGTGGSGGTSAVTLAANAGNPRIPPSLLSGMLFGASGAAPMQGGAGGGGGGGSGTNPGCPGGGGGGVLHLVARFVNLLSNAVLSAQGGKGGRYVVLADSGGGGGGGGGAVLVAFHDYESGSATIASVVLIYGGAGGGSSAGGAANGSAGSNGTYIVQQI